MEKVQKSQPVFYRLKLKIKNHDLSVLQKNVIFSQNQLAYLYLVLCYNRGILIHKLEITVLVFGLFVCFLGPHPNIWRFPGQGSNRSHSCQSTPQPQQCQDLSHVCDLHHRSWQCWNFNPLSKARDQTYILTDSSRVHNPLSHNGNSSFFKNFF